MSPSETFTVRDSAGIEIVENVAPDDLPEWRPAEAALRIGTLEGEPPYQLYRVNDATRLPGGHVAVVNGGSHEVRIFEPDGTFAMSFGGEGEGPGEFGNPVGIRQLGDSLLVFDTRTSRVSRWSRDGEPLGSVTLAPPPDRQAGHAWLDDGQLIVLESPFDLPDAIGETVWWRVVGHRYGLDGALRDTVVEYPAMHLIRLATDRGDGIMLSGLHFTPMAALVTAGDRVFGSDAVRREVEVRAPSGELRRLIRWAGPSLTVEDGAYEAYRDDVLADLEDPEMRDEVRDRLDRTPAEESYPGLRDLHASVDGSLWVRRYDRPGSEPGQRWLVFDGEGRLEGRLWLPEELELHEIGSDYLLGVETDELEIEYVVLYDFDPPWKR